MEKEQKELSNKESLDIIVSMINQAQVNFRQSSFHLLLWGWIIFTASIGHFLLLKFTDMEHPEYAWAITLPAMIVSIIYGTIIGKKAKLTTYADRLYMMVWMGFIISLTILLIFTDNKGMPVILLFTGYATFMSGAILKFKPLIAGGILFWLFAILSFIIDNEYILLVNGISVLTGYLIPGYMLKYKVKDVTF